MSDFSDFLKKYIQEKDIHVVSMAEYCGIDRSTMYRIINGKLNPPSVEIRDKLSSFMHLTPEETLYFNHTYEISLLGKEIFIRREKAKEFIQNFPVIMNNLFLKNPCCNVPSSNQNIFNPEKSCIPISSRNLFHYYVQNILEMEIQSQNRKVALLIQPDCEFLFDFLSNLKLSSSTLHIEHILCMNSIQKINCCYNIQNLSSIIPLFINGINYQVYFFYNDVHAHYRNLNVFPSMILTKKHAITCTSDYKNGVLYQDTKIVSMLWELFSSYKDKCHSLFQIPHSLEEEGSLVTSTTLNNTCLYYIEPEPCLVPFVEESIVSNLVPENFPNRKHAIAYVKSYFKNAKEVIQKSDFYFYFCKEELDKFAQTGILTELPKELSYNYKLSVKERITILENLLSYRGKAHFRFLKPIFEQTAKQLHLCVGENNMYLMFFNISSQRVYLCIQQYDILNAFYDYLGSLDSQELYSEEETMNYFQKTINHLKQSLKENPIL